MKFYTIKHKSYGGIDLHARKMYLRVLDAAGEIRLHRNIQTDGNFFLSLIVPFTENIVVAVECMFTWYRIAELYARENIPCLLSHAVYMEAKHGGKANR